MSKSEEKGREVVVAIVPQKGGGAARALNLRTLDLAPLEDATHTYRQGEEGAEGALFCYLSETLTEGELAEVFGRLVDGLVVLVVAFDCVNYALKQKILWETLRRLGMVPQALQKEREEW